MPSPPHKPNKPNAKARPSKPRAATVRDSRQQGGGVHFHWQGFRPLFDFWGNEIKRFYKLETLASATEYMVANKRDRWLIPGVQQVLGPAPVVSLTFELFQEGRYQLIFRMRAINARRKEAQFAFVAAKRSDEISKVASTEHAILGVLHGRAPNHVVRPFTGGLVYLPDRYGRVEKGREIYAYLTQWLNGYDELGVTRSLQFYINVKTPHTFTIDQTEAIKAQMVETVVRTYDPDKQECMAMPEIASGDFVVTWPKGRNAIPRIKLIACRKTLRHMTPAKLIDAIVGASWDWGGEQVYLIPADPALLFGGFVAALGKDEATRWFTEYAQAVAARRLRQRAIFPLDVAREIASGHVAPAKV